MNTSLSCLPLLLQSDTVCHSRALAHHPRETLHHHTRTEEEDLKTGEFFYLFGSLIMQTRLDLNSEMTACLLPSAATEGEHPLHLTWQLFKCLRPSECSNIPDG